MDKDVAVFLDTAPNGVVLFSLGFTMRMIRKEQGQVFADAFAALPHRVLWQSNVNLTHLVLGKNTMVTKWLPMKKVLGINFDLHILLSIIP